MVHISPALALTAMAFNAVSIFAIPVGQAEEGTVGDMQDLYEFNARGAVGWEGSGGLQVPTFSGPHPIPTPPRPSLLPLFPPNHLLGLGHGPVVNPNILPSGAAPNPVDGSLNAPELNARATPILELSTSSVTATFTPTNSTSAVGTMSTPEPRPHHSQALHCHCPHESKSRSVHFGKASASTDAPGSTPTGGSLASSGATISLVPSAGPTGSSGILTPISGASTNAPPNPTSVSSL